MGVKRDIDSGRKDALGRAIKVSGNTGKKASIRAIAKAPGVQPSHVPTLLSRAEIMTLSDNALKNLDSLIHNSNFDDLAREDARELIHATLYESAPKAGLASEEDFHDFVCDAIWKNAEIARLERRRFLPDCLEEIGQKWHSFAPKTTAKQLLDGGSISVDVIELTDPPYRTGNYDMVKYWSVEDEPSDDEEDLQHRRIEMFVGFYKDKPNDTEITVVQSEQYDGFGETRNTFSSGNTKDWPKLDTMFRGRETWQNFAKMKGRQFDKYLGTQD